MNGPCAYVVYTLSYVRARIEQPLRAHAKAFILHNKYFYDNISVIIVFIKGPQISHKWNDNKKRAQIGICL